MNLIALIALAFAPALYLGIVIYGKDKYDREPKFVLLLAFVLGALSIIPAIIGELLLAKPLDHEEFGIFNVAISAFIGVGLVEELCKFAVLRLHAYRLKVFNEPFDGIIYATFVGLGFATAENVMYVLQGGWSVGVLRMFTAVPGHYAFAVIMGYYVGKAKFEPEKRLLRLTQGVFYATLLHGLYDFFALQKDYPALVLLVLGVLFMALRISKRSIEELQADSVFRFHQNALSEETAPGQRSDAL